MKTFEGKADREGCVYECVCALERDLCATTLDKLEMVQRKLNL